MFFHNLKMIYRNFLKNKGVFFINLLGLVTGITAALLIYLWANDEKSFDKFDTNNDQIYQVLTNTNQNNTIVTTDGTGNGLGDALKKDFPEINYTVTTAPPAWFEKFNVIFNDKDAVSASGNFAGKDYFKVFPYHFLAGNAGSVLADKKSMVISRHLAEKLFNEKADFEKLIGKVVEWKWSNIVKQCVVSGVYEDFPYQSTLRYDFLLSFDSWGDIVPGGQPSIDRGPFNTYILLKKDADIAKLTQKLSVYLKANGNKPAPVLFARKYSDGYLFGKYENGVQVGGRIEYVKLLTLVGIFILIIACFNFMNLATTRASRRMKEIGIKKAMGAGRMSLIYQFLGESVILSFLSLLVAILIVWLLLPQFNVITGKHMSLAIGGKLILVLLSIVVFTGLLSGAYPALYLSHFKPVVTLKGKFKGTFGELWARKGFTIIQFSVSIVFIVSVIVIYNQIKFIETKSLGYNKDNIVYFEMDGKLAENTEAFLSGLKKIPGVINASNMQQKIVLPPGVPGKGVRWEGKNQDDNIRFYRMPVNFDMIETLGIQMKEGRSFSREFNTDSTAVILNETAVKRMELTNPIGKNITAWGHTWNIIGVSKDFHFNSLHDEIKPFIFRLAHKQETLLIMAKIQGQNQEQTLLSIKNYYKEFNPGFSFDYKFLDDDFQAQYKSEKLIATLSKYFAIIATLISCMGLLGLAAFTVEKRSKEVGIRKVLGAGKLNIIMLLSSEFNMMIIYSIILSIPVSYFLIKSWLDNFVYRISLDPAYFIVPALVTFIITWLTVGFQTVRASIANPIVSLKEE